MRQATIEMPLQDIHRKNKSSAANMRVIGNYCYKYKRQESAQNVVCLQDMCAYSIF